MSIKSGKTFSEFNFSTYPHFSLFSEERKIVDILFWYLPTRTGIFSVFIKLFLFLSIGGTIVIHIFHNIHRIRKEIAFPDLWIFPFFQIHKFPVSRPFPSIYYPHYPHRPQSAHPAQLRHFLAYLLFLFEKGYAIIHFALAENQHFGTNHRLRKDCVHWYGSFENLQR